MSVAKKSPAAKATTARTRRKDQQRYAATVWDQVVDDAYLMGKLSERIETGGSANPKALEADIKRHNRIATDLGQFLKDLSDHMNSSCGVLDEVDYICEDCLEDLRRQQSPSKLIH